MLNQNRQLLIIAKIISFIFSPFIFLPLVFFLLINKFSVSAEQRNLALTVIFGAGVVPILLTFLYLKLTGRISDWNISIRSERYFFSVVALFFGVAVFVLLYIFANQLLFHVMSVVLVWFLVFAVITRFWKISAHTSSVSLAVLLICNYFGAYFYWLLLGVPLVVWARIYSKNHSLSQAFGGVGLSATVFVIALISGWI